MKNISNYDKSNVCFLAQSFKKFKQGLNLSQAMKLAWAIEKKEKDLSEVLCLLNLFEREFYNDYSLFGFFNSISANDIEINLNRENEEKIISCKSIDFRYVINKSENSKELVISHFDLMNNTIFLERNTNTIKDKDFSAELNFLMLSKKINIIILEKNNVDEKTNLFISSTSLLTDNTIYS